eukprot:1185219-Prorocentrum_minimum.AAC.1
MTKPRPKPNNKSFFCFFPRDPPARGTRGASVRGEDRRGALIPRRSTRSVDRLRGGEGGGRGSAPPDFWFSRKASRQRPRASSEPLIFVDSLKRTPLDPARQNHPTVSAGRRRDADGPERTGKGRRGWTVISAIRPSGRRQVKFGG